MLLYAIIEQLLYRIFLQNTTGTLILREEQGLKITQIVILSVTIQYKQKTIKIGSWDLIKGDHDHDHVHLIEVAAW